MNNLDFTLAVNSGLSPFEVHQKLKEKSKKVKNVLLKHQAEVVQAILDKKYSVVAIDKGRRTGVTWAVASAKTIKAASSRKAGGCNVLYMGTTLDMAREFIDTCAFWAKAFGYAMNKAGVEEYLFIDRRGKKDNDGDLSIKAFRIDFASGFSTIALSSVPRSLRGFQGDVVIDEAAFIEDFPGIFKAARAMLIWGGHITIISTHDGEDNPFNRLIEDIKDEKYKYKHIHIPFMRAVDCGLYQRICQLKGEKWTQEKENKWIERIYDDVGEDAAEELDAIPSKGSGKYIDQADVIACASDDAVVLRYKRDDAFKLKAARERNRIIKGWCVQSLKPFIDTLEPSAVYSFGMDVARTGDLTCIAIMGKLPNENIITPLVVELRNMPYSSQQQILFYLCDNIKNWIGGKIDATGGGEETAERVKQRYDRDDLGIIEEVKFSDSAYRLLMPAYKKRLEDRSITIPNDREIIDDHKVVVVASNKVPKMSKQRTGKKGNQRHGDSVIAFILGLRALNQYEFASWSGFEAIKDDEIAHLYNDSDAGGLYG